MSLDEVREVAISMGLSPRRSQTVREISYAILDAQADNRAAITQAKEDARAAAGLPSKRERVRGVRRASAKKVETANLKSEQVVATAGNAQEQLAELEAGLKANNHKPNRTVQSVESRKPLAQVDAALETANAERSETANAVRSEATPTPEAAEPAPKKRGRKKKEAQEEVRNENADAVRSEAANVAKSEPTPVFTEEAIAAAIAAAEQAVVEEDIEDEALTPNEFPLPNLGENVIAMGTLECTPDGYGFLRSADYNYLSSPDDVYVSKEQVRQYGLKPGDTVECSIRVNPQPDKFFPMEKVIRINGLAPELAKQRIAFENLTPLFPDQKFKLCTGKHDPLSVRIIDLFYLSARVSAD